MTGEPVGGEGRRRADDEPGTAEPQPATVYRLERRSTDRILGGVASGLADHFGLDPVLFRIGFVVLAVFGGSGVLLYVLGWLLLPEEGAGESAVVAATRDIGVRKLAALALFAIALLVLAGPVWMPLVQAGYLEASLLWSFVLVALGFLLLRGDPPPRSATAPPPSPPVAPPGTGLAKRTTTARLPLRRQAKPRTRRKRSPLFWIVVGAMLLVVGCGALVDNLGLVDLGLRVLLAAAVSVLGAGLIAGAFWGRARWLIPLGILLMPGLIFASVVEVPLRGSVGGHYLYPRNASDLPVAYRVLAGDLRLDMTNFDFNEGRTITVPVHMIVGSLILSVPHGVSVEVDGYIEAGRASFLGRRKQGFGINLDDSDEKDDLTRRMILKVDAAFGSVAVHRYRLVKDLRSAARAKRREKRQRQEQRQEDAAKADQRQEQKREDAAKEDKKQGVG